MGASVHGAYWVHSRRIINRHFVALHFIHHFRIRGDIPNFSCTHRISYSLVLPRFDSEQNGLMEDKKEGLN